jgi:hypothetical protein
LGRNGLLLAASASFGTKDNHTQAVDSVGQQMRTKNDFLGMVSSSLLLRCSLNLAKKEIVGAVPATSIKKNGPTAAPPKSIPTSEYPRASLSTKLIFT